MKRTFAEKLGLVLIASIFAIDIYRAAVQSCTVDEATTYNEYASKSIVEILTLPYDANNQILHTILCRLAVRTLGVSELTLRLPSLLGGLLFLAMSYRLCRLYFGGGWLFFTALGTLVLNPFTLDYLSIARGYGLAAGLLLTACFQLSRHLLEPVWNPRWLRTASFALGFAVAANFTFAIPAVALALVFLSLEMWELRRLRFWDAVNQLILPGTVAAAVIVLLPLLHASPGVFYFGAKTLADSLTSMTLPALVHHHTPLAPFGSWLNGNTPLFLTVAAILMAVAMLAAMLSAKRGKRMPLLLTGGTLALSCAMLAAIHLITGMLYPYARTGLYLVILFTLAAWSAVPPSAFARKAAVAIAAPLLVLFAAQITAGPYNTWVLDSGTKAMVNLVRTDMARTHPTQTMLASENVLRQNLNFYRRRYHLNTVALINNNSLARRADYYFLSPSTASLIAERHLKVLYRDPVSHQILAKAPSP